MLSSHSSTANLFQAIALALLLLMVFALRWPFMAHSLPIFDDQRLLDGTIFGSYGVDFKPRVRWLSYGSFVWLQDLLGPGLWKQRVFNVLLHVATAIALFKLAQAMFRDLHTTNSEPNAKRLEMLSALAVGLWAVHPAVVYSTDYLVQRSILMASLFVVLFLWCFVRAQLSSRLVWYAASIAFFGLAVLSKEHAASALLLALPIYIYFRRPSAARLVAMSAVLLAAMTLTVAVLWQTYGGIVGTVFDENSKAYVKQLEQVHPGISEHVYLLSILNQSTLFFRYGLLWVFPNVQWMSIDIRPVFPGHLLSWQLLGFGAYLAWISASVWLLWSRRGVGSLLGLLMLMPALMFLTEFSTVWLQDPFVIYRSYLWSIAWPMLLALVFFVVFNNNRPVYPIAFGLLLVFCGLSLERLDSLKDPISVWKDAADKVNLDAPPSAVGRWRPFQNLGAEKLDRGYVHEAMDLFLTADRLGEPLGSSKFSAGVAAQQTHQHAMALNLLAEAVAKGFDEPILYFHRGESQFSLGRFLEASESFSMAKASPEPAATLAKVRMAESLTAIRKFDLAIDHYRALLSKEAGNVRYLVGLSMAYIGLQSYREAFAILDPLISSQSAAPAHYARALAHYFSGDLVSSRADLRLALLVEPKNSQYLQLEQLLSAAPQQSNKASPRK